MNDTSNPYRDDNSELAPFAGRQPAFARLHQYLKNPVNGQAMIFVGQRRVGKTAFLQHFGTVFDDTFMSIYIPLKQLTFHDDTDFWLEMVQRTLKVLAERDLTLSRLPQIPAQRDDLREWLKDSWLPELWHVIRYHRRLVILVDDAHVLIDPSGQLPKDWFAYWRELMEKHVQLKLVLTIHTAYENDFSGIESLFNVSENFRLTNLSREETASLLVDPVSALYRLTDQCIDEIYRATGGQPQLIQRAGQPIFRRWQENSVVTLDDVKTILLTVYAQSHAELEAMWLESATNERRVLTAISQLLYENPLRAVDPTAIESWLLETDHPLDITAIHATMRSLEYREMLVTAPSGVKMTAGLMQKWLLENPQTVRTAAPPTPPHRQRLMWLALLIIVLAIGLILVINLSSAPQTANDHTPLPTITLETR
jgi:hypothetical protein